MIIGPDLAAYVICGSGLDSANSGFGARLQVKF